MSALTTLQNTGTVFGRLPFFTLDEFEGEREQFEQLSCRFAECTDAASEAFARLCCCFDSSVIDINAAGIDTVQSKCRSCIETSELMEHWCRFRDLLYRLRDRQVLPYLDCANERGTAPEQIVPALQKQFYFQWMDAILFSVPVLADFNRIAQDQAIGTFAQKDLQQFEINKAMIRAELSAKRPELDMVAAGSDVAVLLREGEKKRRQKNIRSLLAETGELVQQLKPCFLMSPLSVSTFLTTDSIHFDVVVFDEASQIFPQDAIGAICRADQMIVVGDSRQMPPSNFFNAMAEPEDTDEENGDVTDFESILDLCSTSMAQLRLRWHYRSRYEQLISFSNRNFYDNDLITFPSSRADAPGIGVDYFHVDGVFDRKSRTNRMEAELVVDLICRNIAEYPNRSLGVVAFSVAQQELIEHLLARRRLSMPENEAFFRADAPEPFFVKNLETVQGDERDTIIFSVAYGRDAQGRLLHNFGPLNRVGGERRLNVAVTRAKCNVQLVSSMHHTDIDLSRSGAEGVRLLREYLDYAENGTAALDRSVSVGQYDQFDSEFEMEVCDFLRSCGFAVDPQVGCSGYRIDLGLRRPGGSDYVLAIECDGAVYHTAKNARDRDRLRQEILERMGWKFYRIWSTDWFRNRAVEQQRLLEAARAATVVQETTPVSGEEPAETVD